MNEVWNLDPIYKGFDDPAYEADLAVTKEKLAQFTAFAADLSQAEPALALRQGIDMEEELAVLAGKLGLYVLVAGNPEISPNVTVTAQDIPPKTEVSRGTTITLQFTDTTSRD